MPIKLFKFVLILFLGVSNLWAINVTPEYIKVGQTSKEEKRSYYVNISNNLSEPIEIIGVINQCGLNLNLPKKRLEPQKSMEAELQFYSGTVPGRFIEQVKIVYKHNDTIKQKIIKVDWFNKPDRFSKIIIPTNRINLGNIQKGAYASFDIEAINAGNAQGEIVIDKGQFDLVISEKNIALSEGGSRFFTIKFLPHEGQEALFFYIDKKDMASERRRIDIIFRQVDGTNISIGTKKEKDGYIFIPVTLEGVQSFGQILSVTDINGRNFEFDSSVIKRGQKTVINLKLPSNVIDRISSLIFKINFQIKND